MIGSRPAMYALFAVMCVCSNQEASLLQRLTPTASDESCGQSEAGQVQKQQGDSELRQLREERRRLLRVVISQQREIDTPGRRDVSPNFAIYRSWIEAELALSETAAQRTQLLNAYVEMIQKEVDRTKALIAARLENTARLTLAEVALVEAKLFQHEQQVEE